VINSTNFFSHGKNFQFFYIKNLKKETKKNPGLVILLAIFFHKIGEVVVIHKLIYTDLAIKI
jgi:hypothetical protein